MKLSYKQYVINYLEDELEDEDSLLRRTEATVLEITAEGTAGPVKVVLDLVVILPLMLSGLWVPSVLEWKKDSFKFTKFNALRKNLSTINF